MRHQLHGIGQYSRMSMAVGSTSCELTELPDKMDGHGGVGYDVSYIT